MDIDGNTMNVFQIIQSVIKSMLELIPTPDALYIKSARSVPIFRKNVKTRAETRSSHTLVPVYMLCEHPMFPNNIYFWGRG